MTLVSLTGAATVNGIRYSRDQLTNLFPLMGYNETDRLASITYASSAALQKDTAKARHARSMGSNFRTYEQFFQDLTEACHRDTGNPLRTARRAIGDYLNYGFHFLHTVTAKRYPTSQVSKFARQHGLLAMVENPTSLYGVRTLFIQGGSPMFHIETSPKELVTWMDNTTFYGGRFQSIPYGKVLWMHPDIFEFMMSPEGMALSRYETIRHHPTPVFQTIQSYGSAAMGDPITPERTYTQEDLTYMRAQVGDAIEKALDKFKDTPLLAPVPVRMRRVRLD